MQQPITIGRLLSGERLKPYSERLIIARLGLIAVACTADAYLLTRRSFTEFVSLDQV